MIRCRYGQSSQAVHRCSCHPLNTGFKGFTSIQKLAASPSPRLPIVTVAKIVPSAGQKWSTGMERWNQFQSSHSFRGRRPAGHPARRTGLGGTAPLPAEAEGGGTYATAVGAGAAAACKSACTREDAEDAKQARRTRRAPSCWRRRRPAAGTRARAGKKVSRKPSFLPTSGGSAPLSLVSEAISQNAAQD